MLKRELITNITSTSNTATVAGRIISARKMKNFLFFDISDVSGVIQLVITAPSSITPPDAGDLVRASGLVINTKSGQLSIDCTEIEILSRGSTAVVNAIKNTSSNEFNGQRSLNLMVSENLKKMIKTRSMMIGIIREHFRVSDFLEVDTPIISYSRFAGTADIFETKSKALGKSLYLRGTLEDYLKQLVVAGFEKVFQIGDCFRNESPALMEFTMLEATWAYTTSGQMLQFIQDLIMSICEQLPDDLVDSTIKRELSQKIEVVSFWGVLEKYFNVDIRLLSAEEVKVLARKEGYVISTLGNNDYELAKFGYDVIKRKLAQTFESPTFVGRFPASISPLAKELSGSTGEADRGYGFFKGQRLFEVVEEASNYEEQLRKFEAQEQRGHHKIKTFKHDDLLTSLSYGCPPMAGLGFNINRVLAVLLESTRTSDVVPFPLTSAPLPL